MTEPTDTIPWWGERETPVGEGLSFAVGPCSLAVLRAAGEWRVAASSPVEAGEEPDAYSVAPLDGPPSEDDSLERYATEADRHSLRCLPAPADRSVVVRPRVPLFIPPEEEASIFVSSPIWLRLQVGKPWQTLREVPSRRLSDTWLGPSTLDGDLAYALRSHARVRLDEMPLRYHRALTPVVIRNRADDLLEVKRLALPVPYLSIFATASHRLWTEAVTMTRNEGEGLAAFKIRKGPPSEAGPAKRVAEPRQTSESSLLVRAFSNLFHSQGRDQG